jgi:hypothetical protein
MAKPRREPGDGVTARVALGLAFVRIQEFVTRTSAQR